MTHSHANSNTQSVAFKNATTTQLRFPVIDDRYVKECLDTQSTFMTKSGIFSTGDLKATNVVRKTLDNSPKTPSWGWAVCAAIVVLPIGGALF